MPYVAVGSENTGPVEDGTHSTARTHAA
jgi:hypothetical protein